MEPEKKNKMETIQMLMIAVGVGTAVGVNALLSWTLGQKDFEESSRIAVTGVALSVLSAAIFALMGLLFALLRLRALFRTKVAAIGREG